MMCLHMHVSGFHLCVCVCVCKYKQVQAANFQPKLIAYHTLTYGDQKSNPDSYNEKGLVKKYISLISLSKRNT